MALSEKFWFFVLSLNSIPTQKIARYIRLPMGIKCFPEPVSKLFEVIKKGNYYNNHFKCIERITLEIGLCDDACMNAKLLWFM